MKFKLCQKDSSSKARAGIITTAHSEILTPIFMPVGTVATVKGIDQNVIKEELNAPIILGNSYHLYLRPGAETLEMAGGLHKFMNWDRSILTDSGGYQVYSLSQKRKITEEGVYFRSHIDGSKHFFSPENVMELQRSIGSDIMMAFDECTPPECTYRYARESMGLTHRWLDRCLKRFKETETEENSYQSLFPIVQGSIFKDLRKESAERIAAADMPGNAIGGVCHPTGHLYEVTEFVCDILPENKPRYLMGVGTPEDILECISLGIDMFDCVMPTRNGRNGTIFTTQGQINIRNKKWAREFELIDPTLQASSKYPYTKAYLHHLFKAKEILGGQIASIQNLKFYLWLVSEARVQIIRNNFLNWKRGILPIITRKI